MSASTFMAITIEVVFDKDEATGHYSCYAKGIPGASAVGATMYEARENLRQAISIALRRSDPDTHVTVTAAFVKDSAGTGYSAYVPGIPGANSQGETLAEARQNLQDALDLLLKSTAERDHGDPVGQ